VVDGGDLVGIISDKDIFHALVDITGVRHGGHRVCVTIEDRPGTIREVSDIIRRHGFHLQGILTSYEGVKEGSRRVVIRTTKIGDFKGLKKALEDNFRNVQVLKG
jgi:acetoin utilization protein AcuB